MFGAQVAGGTQASTFRLARPAYCATVQRPERHQNLAEARYCVYTSIRTEVVARTDLLIRCHGGKYLSNLSSNVFDVFVFVLQPTKCLSSDPVGFLMCLLSYYLKRIRRCLLQLYNRPKLHRGTL